MANKGRTYAEDLVGSLDRSSYNQQRGVAQNTYNTNWKNVQNQYKNLQEKLKQQQEKANKEYAEGLVDVAESSFNRQRDNSGNLANRGLSSSGLTNIMSQSDTAQKGEDIRKLLKSAGDITVEIADQLKQGNTQFAEEGTSLMNKLADTLGSIGDAETAAQNQYNQALAGIAGAMDEREANNALQAAQRAANGSSGGTSKAQEKIENELEEFYKRATINEVLASPEMTDLQKQNYLGIIFGIDNANNAVSAYNNNINATENYNNKLAELQKAAEEETKRNNAAMQSYQRNIGINDYINKTNPTIKSGLGNSDYINNQLGIGGSVNYGTNGSYPVSSYADQIALSQFKKQGITYEDLAALLYGNR